MARKSNQIHEPNQSLEDQSNRHLKSGSSQQRRQKNEKNNERRILINSSRSKKKAERNRRDGVVATERLRKSTKTGNNKIELNPVKLTTQEKNRYGLVKSLEWSRHDKAVKVPKVTQIINNPIKPSTLQFNSKLAR